jgi:hypothetical protein
VRFSNGNSHPQADSKGDGRGMAIKLLDVVGEQALPSQENTTTQDLILMNSPVFFVRNLKEYIALFNAVKQAKGGVPFKFFFPSLKPWEWRFSEFQIVRSILSQKVESPLDLKYWSTTPYKFGDTAMKFSVEPSKSNKLDKSYAKTDNYLQQVMAEYLQDNEAKFDFFVQIQTDAQIMPIEDPTIEWNAPLQKVATLTIFKQTFTSPKQIEFDENLSYNPWHSLVEHMPLGGINRARKAIYQETSRIRHQGNQAIVREPTLADFEAY